MTRVGVVGATGRMGREVCRAVAAAPDLELVAAVSRSAAGERLADAIGVERIDLVLAESSMPSPTRGPRCSSTSPSAPHAPEHIRWGIAHGMGVVVGTTGFPLDEAWRDAPAGVIVAPNFAIGAVLMMRFAEQTAAYLPAAEVVESHHEGKVDAPSGTAIMLAERIAAGRADTSDRPAGERRARRCSRRRPGRRACPLGAVTGDRGAPRGGLRWPGTDAHDPTRLHGPDVVHARGPDGDPRGRLASRSHRRARRPVGVGRGPVSGRLLAIVAHPDDDTFAVSGTVALHAEDPDLHFVLVHATSGEAGEIAEGSGATRATLGEVRREEDRMSWIALGRAPDRHDWLGLPDHGVADAPLEELVDRLVVIIREERPEVVITFGPDGVTGHPDHITVGSAATEAFHRVRGEGGSGLARLLHNAIPQSRMDAWNDRRVAAGEEPFDPTRLYHPRGVPDGTIGIVVDCSAVVDRKLAAMREHRSQAQDAGDMSDEGLREGLAQEAFVIAWPEPSPGTVLGDVFDGV